MCDACVECEMTKTEFEAHCERRAKLKASMRAERDGVEDVEEEPADEGDDRFYCENCMSIGRVADDRLVEYLLAKAGYTCMSDARTACELADINNELDRADAKARQRKAIEEKHPAAAAAKRRANRNRCV